MRIAPISISLLCGITLVAACGDGGSKARVATGASVAIAPRSGVEVTGNVTSAARDGSVLVFAVLATTDEAGGRHTESLSVDEIGADGRFELTGLPAGGIVLIFLADKANDGVIDPGDPVAVLTDPRLGNLAEGDRAVVGDVQLDIVGGQMQVGSIEVTHAEGGEPAPTPTPAPS